jgi:hypothetical protein
MNANAPYDASPADEQAAQRIYNEIAGAIERGLPGLSAASPDRPGLQEVLLRLRRRAPCGPRRGGCPPLVVLNER